MKIHLFIAGLAVGFLALLGHADAQQFNKGQIIEQISGSQGSTEVEAATEFCLLCTSHPFVKAGLARVRSVEIESYTSSNDGRMILAYGKCKIEITQSGTLSQQ